MTHRTVAVATREPQAENRRQEGVIVQFRECNHKLFIGDPTTPISRYLGRKVECHSYPCHRPKGYVR